MAALLAAAIYFASPTSGCGPFLPDAIFTYALHPDFPLVKYARGELGIIQPSYARSYLVVAYRNLAGVPLSSVEEQAALNLWEARLTSMWYPGQPEQNTKSKIQLWLEERSKVPSAPAVKLNASDPAGITHTGSQPYVNYYNCLSEAFVSAASTLRQRVEKFGAASSEVKAWLSVQDQVFANCSDRPANFAAVIPVAAAPDDNPLIRSDRAYQIAAAYFYTEDFPRAEAQFTQIAADKNSPWSKSAPLLIARSYIREATLGGAEGSFNRLLMEKAEAQLKSIIADKDLVDIHPAAERLLGFVAFRLHPRERLLRLSADLSRKNGSQNFQQDLWDYTALLDEWGALANIEAGAAPTESAPKDPAADAEKSLNDLRAESDLTDWVLTMQTAGEDAANHALERWQHQHSIPWLVAALATISSKHPQAAAMLSTSANTSPDSSAFATIEFHRARLMMNTNQADAARAELDRVLNGEQPNFPPSSRNLLLAQRFKLSRNFDDFLKLAPRDAAGIVTFSGNLELPDDKAFDNAFSMDETAYKSAPQLPLFDADSVRLFNRQLPLNLLKQAARPNVLPKNLRTEIAQVGWVRAVLLDDDPSALWFASIVAGENPGLKSEFENIAAENTRDARHFASVFTILRNPGLRPNVTNGVLRSDAIDAINQYRDNWWCPAVDPSDLSGQEGGNAWIPAIPIPLRQVDSQKDFGPPAFLGDAEKKSATAQWQRIASTGAAPDYLTDAALDWVKSNPTDERVPEALYLAVRSTRFGCTTPATAKLSKQAYDVLHSKYPKSPWAVKMKYWYGAN